MFNFLFKSSNKLRNLCIIFLLKFKTIFEWFSAVINVCLFVKKNFFCNKPCIGTKINNDNVENRWKWSSALWARYVSCITSLMNVFDVDRSLSHELLIVRRHNSPPSFTLLPYRCCRSSRWYARISAHVSLHMRKARD